MRPLARRLRWPAAGLTAVVVLGTGTAYAVTGSDPSARYRTGTATTGDVEQTLSLSGLVDAAKRADLTFGTDGTVSSVEVAVGDTVKAGQVLARLDAGDLDAALTSAKAALARAVAQLAADRSAQVAAISGSADQDPNQAQAPTKNPSQDSSSGTDSAATTRLIKKLRAAQDEVLAAQSTASRAIAAAKDALATQTATCADAYDPDGPTGDQADDPTGEQTGNTSQDTGRDTGQDTCSTALAAVQDAQDVVATAQDRLAGALEKLASLLTQALGSVGNGDDGPSGGGSSTPAASARTSARTSGSASVSASATDDSAAAAADKPVADSSGSDGTGADQSAGGGTVTAAQLASDQAQIEQARADLVTAQQNRRQATIRSTRAGTVASLGAAVGDSVSAGDAVATVIGGTAVTVTTTVTETQVAQVKVGQRVRVGVPGIAKRTTGEVTAIGLVADSSSGTTSYPVTITVQDPTIDLPTGSRALVQIVLATVQDAVTVPTSAVTRTGTSDAATVQVWDGAKVTTQRVTLGVVGTREVAVTRGLQAGTEVVLAAIDDPIEGASSELDQRGGFNGPVVELRGGPGAGKGPATFSSGGK